MARVFLLGGVVWLFGLSPIPQALRQAMREYSRAVEAGAPALAANSLERAAVYYPWREDFYTAAARYRLQAGDLEGVTAYLDRSQVQEALSGEDWMQLGDVYLATGDVQQAEAAWQQGLQAGGSALDLYDRLHGLYQEQGDYPAAVDALRPTLTLRPDEPARAYQLGLYLAALQPGEALVYLELAAREAVLAQPAAALQRAIRTAELEGELAYTYLQAGRQLANLGEWALAGEAFRQAILCRPDYAEAWALLGEARQQAGGEVGQALADLEQALALKPDSALVNSLLGLYWERQGNLEKMTASLAAAAVSEPGNAVWQAEWGRALALNGELDAARERYEAAVQLAPQEALYLRLLAEFSMLYEMDVENTGLSAARLALELQPEEAAALDLLGEVYLSMGNDPMAERFIRRAVWVQPEYAPAWLHLGVLYLYRGEGAWGQTMLLRARQLAAPGSAVADQAQRLMAHYFP